MEDNNAKTNELTGWVLKTTGLGAVAAVAARLVVPEHGLLLAGIILLLLVVMVGGYLWWHRWRGRHFRLKFGNWVLWETSRAPVAVKDPNRQAEVDKCRKRFLEGIEVYRSRGKEIYSVPWYAIIGESGSGKTEAIRHSNLDFPPGLNDFMQGVGGTLNMDWWFTNHGVILDTAGSMVFPEMRSETAPSPMWEEFLQQLKKNRPHCPINGLILVLSVDSLIGDSAATIAQKAGRIARQLDLIQRTLDVRFPVTLLVTKCDKLTGFREFFESIDDPELQDQMVGWSNPDPLDAPFRADLVDQYLEQILQRLRKRRLGLLKDPTPTGGPRARRADEVDALYALPKSFSLIAPRLQRYLGAIFAAGEFSAKPVFLRGIYFTSAMQVGADLDEAVWAALGRPTEVTPTKSSPGDGGRPFFLRHIFLEKVFRERGLVTRATNTRKMLRDRRLKRMGYTTAAAVLVLLFAWLGKARLDNDIVAPSLAFGAATSHWAQTGAAWIPIVVPSPTNPAVYQYVASTQDVRLASLGLSSLAAFHAHLRDCAETSLRSGLFLPLKLFSDVSVGDRKQAQQIVFEASVLRPLIEATRAKMATNAAPSAPAEYHAQALTTLIRLETDVGLKRRLSDANAGNLRTNYLLPLLSYVTETNTFPLSESLARTFLRTYGEADKGRWPPDWLSGGDTLAANRAIRAGLEQFLETSRLSSEVAERQRTNLQELRDALVAFRTQESNWHSTAANNPPIPVSLLASLQAAKQAVDDRLLAAKTNDLFKASADSLAQHVVQVRTKRQEAGQEAVAKLSQVMPSDGTETNKSLPLLEKLRRTWGGFVTAVSPPSNKRLFAEVEARLEEYLRQLDAAPGIATNDTVEPADLDRNFLQICNPAQGLRAYEVRFQIHTQAFGLRELASPRIEAEVGRGWAFFEQIRTNAEAILQQARTYSCSPSNELQRTSQSLVDEGKRILTNRFVTDYTNYVIKALNAHQQAAAARAITLADLASAAGLLTNIKNDLAALDRFPDLLQTPLPNLREPLAATSLLLITHYAKNAESTLDAQAGFPILRDLQTRKTLSLREAVALNATLQEQRDGLASNVVQSYPQAPLAKLKTKVERSVPILEALLTTNGLPRQVTITVSKNEQDPAGRAVIEKYYGLSIVEKGTPPQPKDIAQAGGVEFPPVAVDRALTITSKYFPERPDVVRSFEIGDWAPIRLATLLQYQPRRVRDGAREFIEVSLVVGAKDTETIKARLRFDPPLPEDARWPTSENW